MADLFRNKYRIPSTRLQNWDYRWAGAYFITFCTLNRKHYFGTIENGRMQLSSIGIIADVMWHETKNHAKNVELDAFVVMPNHVHGILILNTVDFVETGHALSLHPPSQSPTDPPTQSPSQSPLNPESHSPIHPPSFDSVGKQRFQHIGNNSISSIIGSYKSAVTKHAHRLGFYFEWQTRFWDHLIRDSGEFGRIQSYIVDNPVKWSSDRFHGR
jgi:putative transposase